MKAREAFGAATFLLAGGIIGFILSPWVPAEKNDVANIILGNVLGWPLVIIGFYFGSSSGSKEKTAMLKDDEIKQEPDS